MPFLFNSLFLFTFFVSGASAADLTCVTGKLKKVEFNQEKIETIQYCYNAEKNILFSKNCVEKKCSAFSDTRSFETKDFLSSIGSPSFKLCRTLGGQPEILEFEASKQFYKLDRCLFKDGSFVDTGSLFAHYLRK